MNSSLYLVLLFIGVSCGLSCTQTYQCSSVSADYNFVDCISGTCVCKNSFLGNATAQSPCSCPYTIAWAAGTPICIQCNAPRSIMYDEHGYPRCVSIAECGASQDANDHQKSVVTQIYASLIAPKPKQILANNALVMNLFSPNVSGRITPVGHYDDFEGTIEYFYGLATNVIGFKIIDLISQDNTASVRVDILFNKSRGGVFFLQNLTQTGFFHFDSSGRVFLYDLTILRLGDASNGDVAGIEDNIRQLICSVALTYCNASAPYLAYNSTQDCLDFLRSIPVGSFDRANSNSLVCRLIHNTLVPLRPQIHCPHVGPTGGGKCIDVPYSEFYTEPYY